MFKKRKSSFGEGDELEDNILQWLLSLSSMSLLGPSCDVEDLTLKGFYKKSAGYINMLDKNILLDKQPFSKYASVIQGIFNYFNINDQESYIQKLEEMIGGQGFTKNVDQLLQLGRTMSLSERNRRRSIVINGQFYFFEMFEEVMKYEFVWPKEGLVAYDLANVILLLRLGTSAGYLTNEGQQQYFDKLHIFATNIFTSYEVFGYNANIGRKLQLKHMALIRNNLSMLDQNSAFNMSYFSIWQYIENVLKKE